MVERLIGDIPGFRAEEELPAPPQEITPPEPPIIPGQPVAPQYIPGRQTDNIPPMQHDLPVEFPWPENPPLAPDTPTENI